MSYRNILVVGDNTAASKTRIAAAANLAVRFKAAITGVFLTSELIPNFTIGDGIAVMPVVDIDSFIKERAEKTEKAAIAARSEFEAVARDAGVPFFWLELCGDDASKLIACARRHDLAVLPSSVSPHFGSNIITAEQIGMASGGPVLVLPRAGYAEGFGRHILFPWKESRESARVLRDALPFLTSAEQVTFLSVSRHTEDELDELLGRHLERHGCKTAKLVVDRNDDASTGEIIRRHIDMSGADLVIMGLYGHSRLQETVLGGVSRHLLATLPAPLLISH